MKLFASPLTAVFVTGLALLSACAGTGSRTPAPGDDFDTETERLNSWFEDVFQDELSRNPVWQSYLGIKDRYGEWTDVSDAADVEEYHRRVDSLATLKGEFEYDALDEQAQLSYRLFEYEIERAIDRFPWRHYNYPVNQMFGAHSEVPSFLMTVHSVSDVSDAEAYLSRLGTVHEYLGQVVDNLRLRAERGIIAPKFVYPMVIRDCENLLKGAPFDSSGEDSTLLADFRGKVAGLELDAAQAADLMERASKALLASVEPGYLDLIGCLHELESKATADDGAWKFPKGGEFYRMALAQTTTTGLSPKKVHQLGIDEVDRIHGEMRAIMAKVGYEGSLQEFFEFMRTDEQFYYSDDEPGRQQYIEEAARVVDAMRARLGELFITFPKADMEVRRVEAFREKSAGKAFYQSGTPDGSRPGIYYANLANMADMPIYQMEALAYHEGIPGHHMQNAIARELEDVPQFRKFSGYTAYGEGWGLYTEYLPKEYGFYADPYSDFGRLAMELWRACRLVVDTGIHEYQWTRDQAIDYLKRNTPNPEGDCIKAIERYIVMPSQATAYKVGMIEILRMREEARAALGDRFDIREFHDVVLTNGPVPLEMLEELVEEWVRSKG